MKETLHGWWEQRVPRERQVIGWGSAGVLLALAYAYLWVPIDAERHRLRATLPTLRADATKMRGQAEEVSRLRGLAVAPPVGAELQGVVQRAASETAPNGKPPVLSMLDERRVSVSWPVIGFDAWTVLVMKLQNSQRLRLESASVDALPESGLVRVQAVFAAGR